MKRLVSVTAIVAIALSVTVLSNPVAFGQQEEATNVAASPTTQAAPSPEEIDKRAAKTQEEVSETGQTQDRQEHHRPRIVHLPSWVLGALLVIAIVGLLAG